MLGIAAAIVALAPIGSQANDLNAVPHVRVSYADLNLNSAAGISTLYARVERAADAVCPADSKQLARHSIYKVCAAKAISDAVGYASIAALSKLYTEKTGTSVAVRFADNSL